MCNIKTGSEIESLSDLQNLITSELLRLERSSTVSAITNRVEKLCKGSQISIPTSEILGMVDETTQILLKYDYIDICCNNKTCKILSPKTPE